MNKVTINFSRDIEEIKESMIYGFTVKELKSLVMALITMLSVWLIFRYVLKINTPYIMYLAVPFGVPFLLSGFFYRCGLSYIERLKLKKEIKKMGVLLWKSSDSVDEFEKAENEYMEKAKIRAEKTISEVNFEKTAKKIKLIIIGLITVIVIIATVAVIIKLKMK